MKCLSICQPFAELIVEGKKTIELRKWNTKFRGEFLVHAARNMLLEDCKRTYKTPIKMNNKQLFLFYKKLYNNSVECFYKIIQMIKSISWNPTLQVMGIFFIHPVVFGVWLALIPEVQSGLNLDKSQLALGLMGAPGGMLMTLPFAGKITNTFGIRKILYVGFPGCLFSITLHGLVDRL